MLPLIPYPQQIEEKQSELTLPLPLILATKGEIRIPVGLLQSQLPDLIFTIKPKEANLLLLLESETNVPDVESYHLSISPKKIVINASTEAGLFYGIQTLRQLIPVDSTASITLPCLEIEDRPAFPWRGFMLDEARHFFGVETVKRILDWLSFFKINRFHWHLTDDQGWRIKIKQYPLLTEIGSQRKRSKRKNRFSHDWDNSPHGGYYTGAEIREIVAYAADRHITIVPEFDLPGHFSAVLAAYPEFGCTKEKVEVQTNWGIFKEVACVGSSDTQTFLKNVLDEICELFPGNYIHLGGDEVKYDHWRRCPVCQAKMKRQNFRNVSKLHGFIMNELAEHLLAKGRTPIVWNEALKPNLSKEVIIMHWTPGKKHLNKTLKAIENGYQVIFQPFFETYFDYAHTLIPLRTVIEAKSLLQLNKKTRENTLGVQGALWTEFVEDERRIQFQCFPRQAAVAENGWCEHSTQKAESFERRWYKLLPHLYQMELNHPAPLSAVNQGALQKIRHAAFDLLLDMEAEQKRYRYS